MHITGLIGTKGAAYSAGSGFVQSSDSITYPADAATVESPVTFTGTTSAGATVELWDTAYGAGYTGNVAGGTISENAVWGPGTVNIQGDVVLAKGYTLTIQPGTTVNFAGWYMLEIRGQIDARGTSVANRDILFTAANTSQGWRGMRLRGDGQVWGSTETNVGSPHLAQYINNCIFEYGNKQGDTGAQATYGNYASQGGGALWTFEQRALRMDGNLFRFNKNNNLAAEFAGAVLHMYLNWNNNKSEQLFENNDFEDNSSTQNGGGMGVWHCDPAGAYNTGGVRVKGGHYYRNVAQSGTGTGSALRFYETAAVVESVTLGTAGNANNPTGASEITNNMGSLTII